MLLEYHLGSIYWFLEGSKRIVILENMPIPVGEWAEVLWGEKKEKFGYGKCDNNQENKMNVRIEKILKKICDQKGIDISDIN